MIEYGAQLKKNRGEKYTQSNCVECGTNVHSNIEIHVARTIGKILHLCITQLIFWQYIGVVLTFDWRHFAVGNPTESLNANSFLQYQKYVLFGIFAIYCKDTMVLSWQHSSNCEPFESPVNGTVRSIRSDFIKCRLNRIISPYNLMCKEKSAAICTSLHGGVDTFPTNKDEKSLSFHLCSFPNSNLKFNLST